MKGGNNMRGQPSIWAVYRLWGVALLVLILAGCGTNGAALMYDNFGDKPTVIYQDGILRCINMTAEQCADAIKNFQGPRGDPGTVGPTGPQGPQGPGGQDGQNGQSGTSCTVTPVTGGAIISCADGTFAMISDGKPGSTIEVVQPCGQQVTHDEVFLRFADSTGRVQVIAFFAGDGSALHSRLSSLLCDGTTQYVTTDRTECHFQLDIECNLINEHN